MKYGILDFFFYDNVIIKFQKYIFNIRSLNARYINI